MLINESTIYGSDLIKTYKEDKLFPNTNYLFSYEILGQTPSDSHLGKDSHWMKFEGGIKFNPKTNKWSVLLRDRNSVDYYTAKYSDPDLAKVIQKLKSDRFSKLEYIRNVKLDSVKLDQLLKAWQEYNK